jgi:hypothetical protein
MSTEGSLYRSILGEPFDLLPTELQRFHDQPDGVQASGELTVRRGPGRLRSWLASLLGLPAAAPRVPVTLQIRVEGDRERWVRHFGSLRMETVQWSQEGCLVEAAGPLRFALKLAAGPTGLRYESRGAWLFGLRLPRLLVPRIAATEAVHDGGEISVSVSVRGPLVGLLVAYEGSIRMREPARTACPPLEPGIQQPGKAGT